MFKVTTILVIEGNKTMTSQLFETIDEALVFANMKVAGIETVNVHESFEVLIEGWK